MGNVFVDIKEQKQGIPRKRKRNRKKKEKEKEKEGGRGGRDRRTKNSPSSFTLFFSSKKLTHKNSHFGCPSHDANLDGDTEPASGPLRHAFHLLDRQDRLQGHGIFLPFQRNFAKMGATETHCPCLCLTWRWIHLEGWLPCLDRGLFLAGLTVPNGACPGPW